MVLKQNRWLKLLKKKSKQQMFQNEHYLSKPLPKCYVSLKKKKQS